MKSRFTDTQRLKIVTEAFHKPGNVTKTANKYKVAKSIIYNWKNRLAAKNPGLASDQPQHDQGLEENHVQAASKQINGRMDVNFNQLILSAITPEFMQEAVTKLIREKLGLSRNEQ